jgi:hypothetical protein
MRILPAFAAVAALAAAPAALAGEASSDAVRTAPAPADADAGVAAQIDAYLKSSPAIDLPDDQAPGVVAAEAPRKVHGEAGLSVGTGGYRSAYAVSAFPVGKSGSLTVAVQESRFGKVRGWGYGYGGWGPARSQSMAAAFSFGRASDGAACRAERPGEPGGLGVERDRAACPRLGRAWD